MRFTISRVMHDSATGIFPGNFTPPFSSILFHIIHFVLSNSALLLFLLHLYFILLCISIPNVHFTLSNYYRLLLTALQTISSRVTDHLIQISHFSLQYSTNRISPTAIQIVEIPAVDQPPSASGYLGRRAYPYRPIYHGCTENWCIAPPRDTPGLSSARTTALALADAPIQADASRSVLLLG